MDSGDSQHSFARCEIFDSLRHACGALLIVVAFSSGGVAHAQGLDRGQGVMDRVRPDYEAAGLRLGSFVAYPAAEILVGYDDNILAEDGNENDDAVFTLAPSLFVESDWARHAISFGADSSSVLFPSESDEQHTDWSVVGNGRLDLLESSNLTASMRFLNLTEDRGNIDAVQVVRKPTEYDQFDVNGTFNHRFNRVSTSLGGSFTRLNFSDSPRIGGGTVDQDFRDRDIARGLAQLGYEVLPGHSAFVRVSINNRNYRKSPPAVPFKRDSFGYEIVTGWSAGISNLVDGEVYLGYLDQNYDSGALRDVDGVSFGLDLNWYATELTTVRGKVSRSVADSTSPGAGGILISRVAIGIDHELMRNVLLNGDLSYESGRFRGTSREDDRVSAAMGVQYLLNAYGHLDLRYRLENRASNVSNLDFMRNQVSMGVNLQF